MWRLDRLGRSLPHLIEVVSTLDARGVGFRSLTESIDTTTPGGRLIFHVFGALGQFERDLIRDRTKAGLAAAAARGRKGECKPVVTDDKLKRAREHLANGLSIREAAARIKVSKTALYAVLKASQPDTPVGLGRGNGQRATGNGQLQCSTMHHDSAWPDTGMTPWRLMGHAPRPRRSRSRTPLGKARAGPSGQ